MEWVEVRGKTIEVAVEAGLRELGMESREQAEIEIIQEPERGFLGLGGRDAVVRIKPRPSGRRRSGRRRRPSDAPPPSDRQLGSRSRAGDSGAGQAGQTGRAGDSGAGQAGRAGRGGPSQRPARKTGNPEGRASRKDLELRNDDGASLTEQAEVVNDFLRGLVDAFGLEGVVATQVEDEVIVVTVSGEQTQALVGHRGSVMESVHELTKTVVQRQSKEGARVRLDVAGYAERRRQALTIYANQLADQVSEEGGEIMLEPMGAGDRKVIHDAIATRQGVRSFSEGEPPQRYVVIAREEEDGE